MIKFSNNVLKILHVRRVPTSYCKVDTACIVKLNLPVKSNQKTPRSVCLVSIVACKQFKTPLFGDKTLFDDKTLLHGRVLYNTVYLRAYQAFHMAHLLLMT